MASVRGRLGAAAAAIVAAEGVRGTVDNGARCFPDARSVGEGTISGTGGLSADVFAYGFAPTNPQVGYALHNGGVARTEDARSGECAVSLDPVTWQNFTWRAMGLLGLNPGAGSWSKSTLAVHPTDPNVVFVAGERGFPTRGTVYRFRYDSDTTAMSYEELTVPAPGFEVLALLAERRGIGRRLYAGVRASGLFVSRTEGRSWEPWGSFAEPPELVLAIERGGRAASPIYYVATSSGLFAGDPERGIDWKRLPTPRGYIPSDVEVDPTEPCRVYVALGYAYERQSHRGGILVSTDFGRSFTSITAGQMLHQGPVTDVEVDPLEPRYVYAATYGHGFWFYDWEVGGTVPSCTP